MARDYQREGEEARATYGQLALWVLSDTPTPVGLLAEQLGLMRGAAVDLVLDLEAAHLARHIIASGYVYLTPAGIEARAKAAGVARRYDLRLVRLYGSKWQHPEQHKYSPGPGRPLYRDEAPAWGTWWATRHGVPDGQPDCLRETLQVLGEHLQVIDHERRMGGVGFGGRG